jgi:hypothetical protein
VLYLGYGAGLGDVADLEGPWVGIHPLDGGLLLIDSEQRRSVVYHALKRHLPRGTAVLVAELDRVPKLAHMAPGALRWARDRAPR